MFSKAAAKPANNRLRKQPLRSTGCNIFFGGDRELLPHDHRQDHLPRGKDEVSQYLDVPRASKPHPRHHKPIVIANVLATRKSPVRGSRHWNYNGSIL
jgi:hypothetical protein